jgi:hypothetical protein
VALAVALPDAPDALAQKKGGGGTPPPPAPGTIYFHNWSTTYRYWSMNGDGSGKTQTVDGQPSWQKHGGSRWFLQDQFVEASDSTQWLAVDEGGEVVPLTNDPTLRWNGYPPHWGRDDSFFSFTAVYETELEWIGRLYVVAVDWIDGVPVAGPPTVVFELRRSVFDEWGQWSYDGLDEVSMGKHDWSPAGDEVALTRWIWGEGWVIDVMNYSESGVESRRLATRAANPVWSPDGSRIAFNREQRSGYQEIRDLWTIRPDGSDARQLTQYDGGNGSNGTAQYSPTWSPDGAYLAFTERVIGGKTTHNVRRIPSGGGAVVSLTSDGKSEWARWRP